LKLREKATRGVLWTSLQDAVSAAVSFIVIVVLARNVAPGDFGLIAEAWAVVFVLSQVGRLGLVEALVTKRVRNRQLLSAVFWLEIAIASALVLLCLLIAPVLASLFSSPRLCVLVRVLSVAIFMEAIGTVPQALLESDMLFSALAFGRLLANLAGSALAIIMAVMGLGVWSLLAQLLLSVMLRNSAFMLFARYLPSWHLDGVRLGELLRFGSRVAGMHLLGLVNIHGAFLIVGLMLGERRLGVFKIAWDLFDKIFRTLSHPFVSVALPTFTLIRNEHSRLNHAIVSGARTLALVLLPACAGLALVATDTVAVLLGPGWGEGTSVMQAFCLLGCLHAVVLMLPYALLVLTKQDQVFLVRLLVVIVQLGTLSVCALFGVTAAAWGYALSYLPFTPVFILLLRRTTGLQLGRYFEEMGRIIAALVVMVTATIGAGLFMEEMTSWVRLGLQTAVGVLAYFLAVMICAPKAVAHASSLLVSVVGDRGSAEE